MKKTMKLILTVSLLLAVILCVPTSVYAADDDVVKVKASQGMTDSDVRTKVLKKEGTYRVSIKTAKSGYQQYQLKFKPKKTGFHYFSLGSLTTDPEMSVRVSFEVYEDNEYPGIPQASGCSQPYLGNSLNVSSQSGYTESINYYLKKGKTYFLQFSEVFESEKEEKQAKKKKLKTTFEIYIKYNQLDM